MQNLANHRIDDESFKAPFNKGQVDNNKEVLYTIEGYYFGECTYAEIAKKLEKICLNNKA